MRSLFRTVRPLFVLGFFTLSALAACGLEPVDDGAATRAVGWNGELTDNIVPNDRDVFLDIDESMPAADPCEKTTADARDVLDKNCASCHSGPNATGLPPWDFVLDFDKLKTATWNREGAAPLRFLVPGDPDNSQIYVRAVIDQSMPPVPTDLGQTGFARVTYSGGSVLREWIANCMGGGP
jgi:hypothetical protein